MNKQESEWRAGAELVDQGFASIQEWMKKDSELRGLDTGFTDLNRILSGLQRGHVILLGGRPAMGKTALMQNIVLNVARKEQGVGIFSLSDSGEQFMLRLISIQSLVSMSRILNGHIDTETELPKIRQACEETSTLPIFVQDRMVSVRDIAEKTRQLKQQEERLSLIVIDYIGMMSATSPMLSRTEAIAETSRGLKDLARELDVCILVISQLNSSLEQREDKRPILSDLQDSGALEQDADVICFMYRDEYYDQETPLKGLAEIIIAKQHNGPVGTVMLQFEGEHLRFQDALPDYLDGFF